MDLALNNLQKSNGIKPNQPTNQSNSIRNKITEKLFVYKLHIFDRYILTGFGIR